MPNNWNSNAPRGGPMVPVPGFPRPLYPPDATSKGKRPSVDGPDVVAYKRTLGRIGAWPWDPAAYDDSYSNGFSHGSSRGPGVEAVQDWSGTLDPTGWIGQRTFNFLRSVRVPQGRTHAGEMAMDANAQSLIAEAFRIFGGKEPVQPDTTVREAALDGARFWLGYTEDPPGSNMCQFGAWYGMDCQPWCAMFVTYCYEVEAGGSPSFTRGSSYAYVPYIVQDARAQRNGLVVTDHPVAGDLVCFDWGRDGVPDHVGLFESGSPSQFNSIEGNTSMSNNSNGGEVMRRVRHASDAAITFVRVAEP